MSETSESSLVREAQQGKQESFSELVVRYQNVVTSIAFSKTGDLQRSEDIAQQAFIIAWQKLAELKEPSGFGAWLRSIIRNTVSNSNRKAKNINRFGKTLDAISEPTTEESPREALSLEEQQNLLWASLKGIPEKYREPLILYYREDKSVKQVAAQLGLSTTAVKQRLARGRTMLKSEMHQFVEDILGATKPNSSFSSNVVAALPVVAGKLAVQSGASAVTGLLSPVIGMWAGLFGVIFGMKVATKHSNATVNKNFFFWYCKIATFVTFIVLSLSMIPFYLGDDRFPRTTMYGLLVYFGILVVLTIYFAIRQKRIDRSTNHEKKSLLTIKPAEPAEFKKAITAVTLGCWSWILFISYIQFDWLTLSVSALVIIIAYNTRRNRSESATSVPDQIRFQGTTFGINIFLSSFIFLIAGYFERPAQLFDIPNWQVSLFAIVFGSIVVGSIWNSSNKFQKGIDQEKESAV